MLDPFADWTFPRVLAVGTVLFNLLFILMSISIEAFCFNRRLKVDKRTSIFYAIAINLFSNVIGWIVFFIMEPVLPLQLKSELINFVFFNSFKFPNTQTVIILSAFIIFFGTFIVKLFLLKIFSLALEEQIQIGKKVETAPNIERQKWRYQNRNKFISNNLVSTMLIANSLSYSAITLVLLIRTK